MAIGMISVEGIPIRRTSGKPRLLLRGRRRKATLALVQKIDVLMNQEFAENRRSAINKYSPFFVMGNPNSNFNVWLAKIRERANEALAAKA